MNVMVRRELPPALIADLERAYGWQREHEAADWARRLSNDPALTDEQAALWLVHGQAEITLAVMKYPVNVRDAILEQIAYLLCWLERLQARKEAPCDVTAEA